MDTRVSAGRRYRHHRDYGHWNDTQMSTDKCCPYCNGREGFKVQETITRDRYTTWKDENNDVGPETVTHEEPPRCMDCGEVVSWVVHQLRNANK